MTPANPTYNWRGQVCSEKKGTLSPLHHKYYFPFNLKSNERLFSLKFPKVKHLLAGTILVGPCKDSSYLEYSIIIWFVRLGNLCWKCK